MPTETACGGDDSLEDEVVESHRSGLARGMIGRPGRMITNPRTAQRRFRVRVRNGVIFSLGFRVNIRVVQFE